jgi:23S rRNA (cytidine1920-2'-O)/16S rRNA (cytidine1409-2'-O)-methyltransferase
VRDAALRQAAVDRVAEWLAAQPGWHVRGVMESPIAGAEGNIEYLIAGRRG